MSEITEFDFYEGVEDAMDYSYRLITEQTTFEDLFEEKEEMFLIYDIDDYDKQTVVDDLLSYYESEEDYERCSILLKLKNEERT